MRYEEGRDENREVREEKAKRGNKNGLRIGKCEKDPNDVSERIAMIGRCLVYSKNCSRVWNDSGVSLEVT